MKVRAKCCENCLFGPNPIVEPERKRSLIAELRRKDTHFICHLSPDGEQHTCRASFETMPQMARIAMRLGVVRFVSDEVSPEDGTAGHLPRRLR